MGKTLERSSVSREVALVAQAKIQAEMACGFESRPLHEPVRAWVTAFAQEGSLYP